MHLAFFFTSSHCLLIKTDTPFNYCYYFNVRFTSHQGKLQSSLGLVALGKDISCSAPVFPDSRCKEHLPKNREWQRRMEISALRCLASRYVCLTHSHTISLAIASECIVKYASPQGTFESLTHTHQASPGSAFSSLWLWWSMDLSQLTAGARGQDLQPISNAVWSDELFWWTGVIVRGKESTNNGVFFSGWAIAFVC